MDESLICSQTAADAPLRSDMRAHLRVLGHHKASYEAIKAATNKDKTLVHDVLTRPPALMGLKPADIETVCNEARKSTKPELFKAHAEAGKVIERMIVASKAIGKKREKVASHRIADQRAASDALKHCAAQPAHRVSPRRFSIPFRLARLIRRETHVPRCVGRQQRCGFRLPGRR